MDLSINPTHMAKKSTGKPLTEHSVEELNGMRKTITGILAVMGALLLLYVGYYGYVLATGTWNSSHNLGITGILVLVAVSTPNLVNLSRIRAEIARRNQA